MAKQPNYTHLKETLERIDKATEGIQQDVNSLKVTAAQQQTILDEHMRRTEANEKALELAQQRLTPLEHHVTMWGGVGKALAVAGAVITLLGTILGVIQFFKH